MTLEPQVRRAIQSHKLIDPADTVVVGVSGGPDSLCLLHVLYQLAPDLGLRLRRNAALNALDVPHLYGGGAQGYTDYPTLHAQVG